jgi:hypothetical protein
LPVPLNPVNEPIKLLGRLARIEKDVHRKPGKFVGRVAQHAAEGRVGPSNGSVRGQRDESGGGGLKIGVVGTGGVGRREKREKSKGFPGEGQRRGSHLLHDKLSVIAAKEGFSGLA